MSRSDLLRWIRGALLGVCVAALLPAGSRLGEALASVGNEKAAAQAYERGLALLATGRPDEAAELFRRAIVLVPDAVGPRRSLADLLARQGKTEAAVALYRSILAAYPAAYEPAFLRERGIIEFRGGRLHEARRDFVRTLDLNPSDWLAAYYLGHTYARLGDRDAARREWRRAVILNPQFRQVHANLRDLGPPRP
ncbi:MAG: tetratricopeptide repeat protein [Armatimonadota bacterium]|nr:tetratricopeptide repeat protein [Armatimonadota bacterium]MDR7450414.1 tetratricopeptide repeat protein [Armatimonadota bacterium]MDR7467003.1 tetratricopeptide repeat protein [Armatimonadota bacterium]MDR7493455.1 tetratricopeptide repeat protein [Armatimonadota bacterium]MDR7498720.1 tetratricopeptide repeat protein [Armatimonadota bacterium]